ncbi:tetratricopeptide repeat protein [Hydrogenothermus marinus]|uniref:Tol-pal system protein YbgF n=1 Tax=Hydrogenothermus marinus TaxID=133270 RepID=A0A3M0B646_9AQUI|nr:tetratricopeptide repeat protein [Hydrogenothermus marinus]RMA92517.1 tol-pal system protein YbgF [Hydrogenothermus marinus]
MIKKAVLFSSIIFLTTSCVQDKTVITLQNQIIEIKKEVKQLKKHQLQLESKTDDLANKLDEVSNKATKNELEIQKLKLSYKPPKNPPLEGQEKVKTPQNSEDIYDKALDLYYEGKLEEAKKELKRFLNTSSKDSKYYDNALFWLGQIYYTEGQYDKAINTFENLINECETGQLKDCNKIPDTLLKLAYSYLKIGEKEKAIKYLKQLLDKYPDSDQAKIAKKKLEVLDESL